jgi:hypothetical protein
MLGDKESEHLVAARVGNGSESGEIGESIYLCLKSPVRVTVVKWML